MRRCGTFCGAGGFALKFDFEQDTLGELGMCFGRVSFHLSVFGLVWPCLALFGAVWDCVWHCLALFGAVWCCFCFFRAFLCVLNR